MGVMNELPLHVPLVTYGQLYCEPKQHEPGAKLVVSHVSQTDWLGIDDIMPASR